MQQSLSDTDCAAAPEWRRSQLMFELAQLFPDPPTFVDLSSPEDTILAKPDWYRCGGEVSSRQWNDILSVLRFQRGRLEMDYLMKRVAELGVGDLLTLALEQAER
jgi:hypothetical protein